MSNKKINAKINAKINKKINAKINATEKPKEDAYVESLSEKEKVAYNIAVDFLKTSFDLERSLGYVDYVKTHYLREDS